MNFTNKKITHFLFKYTLKRFEKEKLYYMYLQKHVKIKLLKNLRLLGTVCLNF